MTQVLESPSGSLEVVHKGSKVTPAQIAANTERLDLRGTDGAIEGVSSLMSCSPDCPLEELRSRYAKDGVLWVSFA
jgi:hypothetical protein